MTLDVRPLTIGELFDRAFVLYRRHFRLFVGITAAPGVCALLLTLIQQAFTSAVTPPAAASDADAAAAAAAVDSLTIGLSFLGGMLLALVLYYVVYMVALGATTFAVSEIYVGRAVTIAEAYRRMRGRTGALVILLLLVGLRMGGVGLLAVFTIGLGAGLGGAMNSPIVGGVIMFFGALIFLTILTLMALRYSISIPALVLEGLPPGDAIRRSIELTRGRLGRVFLMIACASMITYAAFALFQGPFIAAAMIAGIESTRGFWLSIVGAIFGTIGTTITAPFMIIGLALIYYDARIREEGFDLELSLAALDAR